MPSTECAPSCTFCHGSMLRTKSSAWILDGRVRGSKRPAGERKAGENEGDVPDVGRQGKKRDLPAFRYCVLSSASGTALTELQAIGAFQQLVLGEGRKARGRGSRSAVPAEVADDGATRVSVGVAVLLEVLLALDREVRLLDDEVAREAA